MDFIKSIDFNVAKYNNLELREILGLSEVYDNNEIMKQINNIQESILKDSKLQFSDRNKVHSFLTYAKDKLISDKDSILNFSFETNKMVNHTPESNPLIVHPNQMNIGVIKPSDNKEGRGGYYPPGQINPIDFKTIKRYLNIDSRFRSDYYNSLSSNFHLDLPETFKRVVSMTLMGLEMPISIYGINEPKYFKISKGQKEYKIEIRPGNYQTPFTFSPFREADANFQTYIKKELDSIPNNPLKDLKYIIDSIDGRSEFINNTGELIKINFGDDNLLPFSIGWLMGFRYSEYEINIDNTIKSDGIANFQTPRYLYISIEDFTNASSDTYVAAFSDSTLTKHIISRVNYQEKVQDSGMFNIAAIEESKAASRLYYGPVDIQKLHLRILDEHGRIVNFNNMDWSCTLEFNILYD